ncbi:MAG: hypothetical protein KTR21_01800 [Rhodobacteraceae bacterium]|nr:hypothetical protein [Paracoccaceae bacterium]
MPRDFAVFDGFDDFKAFYKPHVRPEWSLERMRKSFGIDVRFLEEFRLLRPYLREFGEDWSERILSHAERSTHGAFDRPAAKAFASVYRGHARQFHAGQFDAAYLSSIEDVALFMIYHDVKPLWLAGAFEQVLDEFIEFVFDHTDLKRSAYLKRVISVASRALTIEMSQVQRVAAAFEAYRLSALLEDMKTGQELRVELLRLSGSPIAQLSPEEIALVQESFHAILPQTHAFARKFWEQLRLRDEEVYSFFDGEAGAMQDRFVKTLAVIIDGLERFESTLPLLEKLGRVHGASGVTARHYDAMGEALFATLEKALGNQWTPLLEHAWRQIYQALARAMMGQGDH